MRWVLFILIASFCIGASCVAPPDPCKEGVDNLMGEVVVCNNDLEKNIPRKRNAGIVLSKTTASVDESGTTDTVTIKLLDEPESAVYLDISSNDTGEATVSHSAMTFTPVNWDTAQTLTITGANDTIQDGSQTAIISIGIDTTNTLETYYMVLDNSTIATTVTDDDVVSFVLSTTTASVSELGTTANFNIKLGVQPTSNVVINLTASDTGEATVSPSSFTFTTSNWDTAQIATITGVYDTDGSDGNVASTITASVNDGSSADEYDVLADQTVTVTTTDSTHTNTFTLSKTTAATSETGTTDTVTLVLNSIPASNVVFALSDNDSTELTLPKTNYVFTSSNWSTPQTITPTGVDDDAVDGDQTVLITVDVNNSSSTTAYASLASQYITVTNSDQGDSAGYTVTETSGSTAVAENGTDNITVVLTSQPLADVVFSVVSNDTDELTVSPSTLTFTSSNWNTAQTITATGVNDNVIDGTFWGSISISVSSSVDATYAAMSAQTINTTITDARTGAQRRPFIVAGDYHYCAQDNDGSQTIYCWGDDTCYSNSYGYCDVDKSDGSTPHDIGSGQVYPHMPDDSHMGDNSTNVPRAMPMSVLPANAQRLSSEDEWTCAVNSTGDNVTCWGRYRMSNFGVGSGEIWTKSYPNNSIYDIDMGFETACVLWDNRTVSCWGYGRFGSIGDGNTTYSDPGSTVVGLTNVVDLALTYQTGCALHDNGTVSCWGKDLSGNLGDNDQGANAGVCGGTDCSTTPVPVAGGISNFIQIEGGNATTCGVLDNGSIACWGKGDEGRLGNGQDGNSDTPVYVTGITTATRVDIGQSTACAIIDNKTAVKCWGYPYLGDSNSVRSNVPVSVVETNGWTSDHRFDDIAVGYSSVCVYDKANEDIFCWGANQYGQLGIGSSDSQSTTMRKLGSPF